jgi:maltoporin
MSRIPRRLVGLSISAIAGRASSLAAALLGIALAGSQVHAQPAPEPAPAPAPAPGDPVTAPATPSPTLASANPLAEQQLEQVRQMIVAMPKMFEFHGYFRSGFGINAKGGDQDAFAAPGAFAKYRLGNETETYGEIGFDANWLNPDHTDTWFKTSIKLAIVAPRNSTFDVLNAIAVRESFVEAGKVLASHPEMSLWAGQRFYRRRDVHINDFFFNDMSGYGAGFQDLKVGDKMKLNVAYLGGSAEIGPGGMAADLGRFAKNTFDLRLSDIPVGTGTLELWLIPTLEFAGDADADAAGIHHGIGGGVFFNMPFMGGFNEISAEFGFGGAANLSSGLDTGIADSGWLFRVVERATVQMNPKLSMMWTGVLQLDNRNGDTNGSGGNLWISAGARPVYCFTKYTGIAFEGGVDIVKAEAAPGATVDTGFVGKLTVAPLIRPGTDFWARPELRAYVTAAFWNDGAGDAGGPAFAGDNFGLTMGVQAESWW